MGKSLEKWMIWGYHGLETSIWQPEMSSKQPDPRPTVGLFKSLTSHLLHPSHVHHRSTKCSRDAKSSPSLVPDRPAKQKTWRPFEITNAGRIIKHRCVSETLPVRFSVVSPCLDLFILLVPPAKNPIISAWR